MQIILIKSDKIYKYPFPGGNVSSYWIKDIADNGNEKDLMCIEKVNNKWVLFSNENCHLEDNGVLKQAELRINVFYKIVINSNVGPIDGYIYICEENDNTFKRYNINDNCELTIGSSDNQNIVMKGLNIHASYAILTKNDNGYIINNVNDSLVYVNDTAVSKKALESGDIIFIYGYKIIILGNGILINNPFNSLNINSNNLVLKEEKDSNTQLLPPVDDDNAVIYNDNDYYSRQPRFVTTINEEVIQIDNPPAKIEPDDMPLIYTLGPMLTMTMTSAVSITTTIMNMSTGKSTWGSAIPALLIAGAMIASTLLWPSLMKRYNKKRQIKSEEKRQKKYTEYLEEKKSKILTIKNNQFQVLNANYPDPKDLQSIIINKKRNLWERQINSEDFLHVRVGIGTVPAKLKLNYSIEDFSMVEDNLKQALTSLTTESTEITNAPVTVDLTLRNKLVLIGDRYNKENMLKSILLQLITNHAYDDLKLVFMVNEQTSNIWNSLKILPHAWSDSKNIRFYANNYDEMSKISFYLEQVWTARKYNENDGKLVENEISYKNVKPYYLIIVDNIKKNKNIEIIDKILKEENNLGFGLIILNDNISDLPNECNDFLSADGETSAIIKNDLNKNNQQKFAMDDVESINLPLMCEKLSNLPIKSSAIFDEMDSSVTFLEMYKCGKVEDLNILERWEASNPVNSLSVPIGIHSDGELFNLDLHEKFHGPHGLIAGMTGSGKSEFIITYILSMCINYSPEEVSFVLIDYKGGGLTGAFENKLTGLKLPHLAGTITNLDTAEINRSLASIQSEIKRRQALFNDVKAKLNESTLDIYKYQQLYRAGVIDEPVSHLFIISDEFAELKNQQSEFMTELISIARIGRSLGVHLILATQKPSGIVDDQIWSNSKFKVCLKVQERADSMDVIKCPDAVTLKKAGRFYLQVGYNDYFAMGQAAYAGAKYVPKEKAGKAVDRDILFVNNIGDIVKNVETSKRNEVISKGEEVTNILKYICDTAKEKGVKANQLWLDKMPSEIYVSNLIKKYSYNASPWNIEAIIGEYDDPNNQKQGLLKLDFNDGGNTLIYGINGKEIMLSSIIYSLITMHTSEEINIYVIDFGTEMFGTFVQAPQVGDVVFLNESEKLNNLFNTISKELERRKKLFADYNGSYNIYIKNSGKTLPRLLVFINNYESLYENYEDYVDVIASLSREGDKYGISFIITATGANSVRGKTAQNFNHQFCLQFNDPSDYMSILGLTHGMVPSEIDGRGLVKLDGTIFEFQTAYPYKWDEINIFIKNVCAQLNQLLSKRASQISILPNHVRLLDINNNINGIDNTPIGIEKSSLSISTYDFAKHPISLVSAQETSLLEKFLPSLGQVFQNMHNVELYMIDSNDNIKDTVTFKHYYDSSNMKEMYSVLEKLSEETNKTNIIIIYEIEPFINAFDSEKQRKLKTMLSNLKNKKDIRVIIADSISKIKMFEYEDFYKNCVQPTNAIWVGNGIVDQFTIKSSTYNKETRSQIPSDFGYKVDKGTSTLVKLLDFYTEE